MRLISRTLSATATALATCLAIFASSAAAAPATTITFGDGSYATDLPSSAPTQLQPGAAATLPYPSAAINLSWKVVPGASSYELQVARQSSAAAACSAAAAFQVDNVVVTKQLTSSSWIPSLSTDDGENLWTGTYCWRVRASGAAPGPWSAAHRFVRTWDSTPSGLRFYNDVDGSIPRASTDPDYATGSSSTRNAGYLAWTEIAGAATYEIEVGTSQSFSQASQMVTRDGISDGRTIIPHLPDDTYYWRVRGVAPNGTEGAWSTASSAFTVKWMDPAWSDPARTFPADSTDASELRVGWTPMPGATYYEYQISTGAGCFWDPGNPNAAPDAYGDWVNYPAYYSPPVAPATEPVFEYTFDAEPTQCRISAPNASTMNNWVTLDKAVDPEVLANLTATCVDEEGKVRCKPAPVPDDQADDYSAFWRGASMGVGAEDLPARQLYWRVRPVYTLTQGTETAWEVNGDFTVYGSWSRYKQGGANREFRFDLHLRDASQAPIWPTATTGVRCESPTNPTSGNNQCLTHSGASMQADQALAAGNSSSMQFPVLTWNAFPGAGGYMVQIARDPEFNNIARTEYTIGVKSLGWGFQRSLALTDLLADNSEGTGYWWRAIPCTSSYRPDGSLTNCMPLYSDGSVGLPEDYADTGVAQTFTKRTAMQVDVIANFEASSPLLRWTSAGVGASDHAGWARGIAGADHYELQLARDPFMTKDLVAISTTSPRAVPFKGTASAKEELPDGIWYFRVRGVDRGGVDGSWTDVASFNKRIASPTTSDRAVRASGGGAVIAWSAVKGASDYTVQWSPSAAFEGTPGESTTRQTTIRITNATPGSYYWRVRGNVNGIAGQWSAAQGPVYVAPNDRLRFSNPRATVRATEVTAIHGQLLLAGTPRNGELVSLERKTVGCGTDGGAWKRIASAKTGRVGDDGVSSYRVKVIQNTCFRLSWSGPEGIELSAPISVRAKPVLKVKLLDRKVKRASQFCVKVTSNTPLTGRLTIEYKVGKKWNKSKAVAVKSMKSRKQCARITAAGKFPLRVTMSGMKLGGWQRFDDTTVTGGSIKIIDTWKIVR